MRSPLLSARCAAAELSRIDPMDIGILGAGTWGVALARMLELNGHNVTVWSVLPREIEQLENATVSENMVAVAI